MPQYSRVLLLLEIMKKGFNSREIYIFGYIVSLIPRRNNDVESKKLWRSRIIFQS